MSIYRMLELSAALPRRARLLVATGLAVVIWGAPALAAKAPSCPPGRFFLEGGARVLPAGDAAFDAIVLDGNAALSIASGCPPVGVKTKKRGTKLLASWPAGACTGVPGKAKLSVRFAPGCDALSGTFDAKKLRAKFTANRSDGVLLEGEAGDPALAALVDLPPQPAAQGDVVGGLLLTRLAVGLAADASIGQVNDALGSVDGSISAMRAGLPAVTVAIPRQNGPEELRALADSLAARPGIRVALLAREAALDAAPPAPANSDAAIGYLQAAGFPAAWNARAAAACVNKVTVVVGDSFHRPIVLDQGFATQVPGVTDLGLGTVDPLSQSGFHGYDVLTTLAAKLDAKVPTGANPFPECLDIKAVQLVSGLSDLDRIVAIDDALLTTSGKVVLNTSYGFGDACGEGPSDPCTPGNLHAPRALDRAVAGAWQRRQLSLDGDTVLVTSTAGNNADDTVAALYPGAGQAEYNSAINVAATADAEMSFVTDSVLWEPTSSCQPDPCPSLAATPEELGVLAVLLTDLAQIPFPPASNVVIVGSSDNVLHNPSEFSEPGADVFAVGEEIPTLFDASTTQGTSFAAPQVAGLAAYLWMLSPELQTRPVEDTIAAIEDNTSSFPFGLIDAYATVLSLDQTSALTPATAKMRMAILDLNSSGSFEASDLQAFHDAYVDLDLVIEPTVQDYSRQDLNGDGFTGGSRAARFDLDPTGSEQFGARSLSPVTTEVGGEERSFDEASVTDADVLCFYANSPLYTGALPAREEILSDLGCGSLGLPTFAGTVTETFEGTDGETTVSSVETYDVVLEGEPDGRFATSGSASLRVVIDRDCQPGTSHVTVDASAADVGDIGDPETFTVGLSARVEGTVTEIGTGSCEEDFVEGFAETIRTDFLSRPEFAGARIIALVWDTEVEAVDPFELQIPGILRVSGRLERVD